MKPIKILVAGDLMPSENNFALFEEGNAEALFGKEICQMFADADFSIANLEGALTDSTVAQQKDGPSIKAPKATVSGIKKLGLKAVALANNHITDYLQQGIDDTLNVLEEVEILHVGIAPRKGSPTPPDSHLSITINDKMICIYNVSETFFCSPTKNTAGANIYDEWIVLNEIKELKQNHDFLMVIYHGGAEYLRYPTPQTRIRFHRMADCGADFITAQHTHCIGCDEWYDGSYLLYGQGNFLFARQKSSITKQGLLTEITLNEKGFRVKHHVVNTIGNVLRYDTEQDFSNFKKRSGQINDEDFIIRQYAELKTKEIMPKYLFAMKGHYPFRRIFNKLWPRYRSNIWKSYTFNQMLMNLRLMNDERRREDMYYVWKHLLELNR